MRVKSFHPYTKLYICILKNGRYEGIIRCENIPVHAAVITLEMAAPTAPNEGIMNKLNPIAQIHPMRFLTTTYFCLFLLILY